MVNQQEFTNLQAGQLQAKTTLQLISRQDTQTWVMGHVFIAPETNPATELPKLLDQILPFLEAHEQTVWPLDPVMIAYFSAHPNLSHYWYHRPWQE